MSKNIRLSRRNLLVQLCVGACALTLGGCRKLSESAWFTRILSFGEKATYKTQRLFLPRKAMAQEFLETERSPHFRSNGTSLPKSKTYKTMADRGFADYRLEVGGLVEHPSGFSLADIRALPSRTQTTRHDCVEGWSAVGTWKGVRLSTLLEMVHPKPHARFVVFHCADPMKGDGSSPYYESIDMEDAFHPQTILAYALNDMPLPIANGAPLRLRLERQLGYKMAKYVMRIELVEDFSKIAGGKGGYWEDRGYEWYAGI
ncbi:MAG: molybdopterin-dependent oxidoreductase [Desulfuromonadales bacterium]|nr:molybdopterin-dependent oxidoreductase [Desulfuromonadales bacterium]